MNIMYQWYTRLSNRTRDSIIYSIGVYGFISTFFSILGISLGDWQNSSIVQRVAVVVLFFGILFIVIYYLIGVIFKKMIKIEIRKTPVSITCGNIFSASGLRVIGCDTHFDTRVDDVVISKKSLHGQLVLEHAKKEEIELAVEKEAKRLGLEKNKEGMYEFPLGTIVRYDSSVDNHTYLLLALTELNAHYEAHTNMIKFEAMLMKMWQEINRVYASQKVSLPLLGAGISRFDDGTKNKDALLRCMLCTLNNSGVTFNSEVNILIYGDIKDIPLYEYRNVFQSIPRR